MEKINDIKDEAKKMLGKTPGIIGFGITWDKNGKEILRINVSEDISQEAKQSIPTSINGVAIKTVTIHKVVAD